MEQLLSEESAQEQLQLLLDYYGANLEELGSVANHIRSRLLTAISQGKVEIVVSDEGLRVTQNLRSNKSLVYHEATGQAKVVMERYNGPHEKLYNLLAVLSKRPVAEIQRLAGIDLSIAECLAAVFLTG